MPRMIQCIKLGIEAEGLAFAPVPGALGRKIMEQVSAQAWQQWLTHQTMLINEHRLNLRDTKDKEFLMQELEHYFFGRPSAS